MVGSAALSRLRAEAARALLAAAVVASLAGCAAMDSQGDPAVPIEAPAAAPHVLVESASSAEHKRMVALFGGEYKDAAAERYLNGVLAKFADAIDDENRTYRITILNSPIVNAFALPSGDLFVTRGLLALANDGSEVAAVMAHEIAHVTKRHALARAEQEKRAAVISKAAMVIQNRQRGEEVEATAKLSIAGFSRQQELEADETGIKTIARAGFDPYGASRFLASLGRSSALRASLIGQNASSAKPDILATHPSTPERVAQAVKVARSIAAPDVGTSDRDAYLSAIDLMMFGDDPSEGTIRGRKFVQPRLGFSFVAPDGFVLENSTQAVLGVKEGGAEALRLDSVAVPGTTSLETYVASGWIDGLVASSVATIDVNGMAAITATARAGEWNFRLAVIRFSGSEVYRLIFATHALDPGREKQFRAAIDSFRKIDPDEAGRVQPLRIGLLTAKAGDTAASVSARMVVPDKPLETFELLNGLESAGPLKVGQRYKLVVE
ncbi:M48 family metalloprotease [Beijerinckia sp. L45]|uniref:M48 family metalloprotease n=1 Tax=Beijerinckia sp. L45 TaxID=1641855 RepID=UPI00131E3C76|nr:M48 family metalloprotease [Beijerinckia sp. L45]